MKKLFFILVSIYFLNSYSFTLVIDPGHGGPFEGSASCNNKILEKDLVLEIAQQLVPLLKKQLPKINIVLTRTSDTDFADQIDTALARRSDFIRQQKPDLFISIHSNKSTNANVRGCELYVPYRDTPDIASYAAALYIHHELVHASPAGWSGKLGNLNMYDRGIRQARFRVLQAVTCPSVLIELDYLTNPEAEKLYLSETYKKKITEALAQGIIAACNNLTPATNTRKSGSKKCQN